MTKPVIDPATLTEEQMEATNYTFNSWLDEMHSKVDKILEKLKGE